MMRPFTTGLALLAFSTVMGCWDFDQAYTRRAEELATGAVTDSGATPDGGDSGTDAGAGAMDAGALDAGDGGSDAGVDAGPCLAPLCLVNRFDFNATDNAVTGAVMSPAAEDVLALAVNEVESKCILVRLNGGVWTRRTLFGCYFRADGFIPRTALVGASTANFWAPVAGDVLHTADAGVPDTFATAACSGVNGGYWAAAARGSEEMWAVSTFSGVCHYRADAGYETEELLSSGQGGLESVWMGPTQEVLFGTNVGTVVDRDAGEVFNFNEEYRVGLAGTDGDNLWARLSSQQLNNKIARREADAGWSIVHTNSTAYFHQIRVLAPNDVWVIGGNSTLLHWDGTAWTPLYPEVLSTAAWSLKDLSVSATHVTLIGHVNGSTQASIFVFHRTP